MKNKAVSILAGGLVASLISFSAVADDSMNVKISPKLDSVGVVHMGDRITIQRDQDKGHTIPKLYSKTSRSCPPFCIQPGVAAPGVETIAELEMLDYVKQASTDNSVIVIDSRTSDWVARGTIPGSVNIPWTDLSVAGKGAWEESEDAPTATDVMKDRFGVKGDEDKLDFSDAKTLVFFCNGSWCHQSTVNIRSLVKKGYPANKIKWYRGGMQSWVTLGLTTVPPQ
ncbi:rhodanese-like domain-containing protein [uncultured Cocleimonas sp.]|uniref:rhodanese-like domain-containing protein n=1 Tax=uncultured Cocleimonas sp. TaxID=1051587 RepID=UPI00260D9CD5|nr:rhodanese-like domain-containing protein [uncultured Cocleimonas sp.]